MKFSRSIIGLTLLSLVTLSSGAMAQVASINFFQPLPGKAPLTLQYMQEAKVIHEEMGATVGITQDMAGQYGYAMYFESWQHMGQVMQSMPGSASWQAFQAKTAATPSATQTDNLQLTMRTTGPGVQPGYVSDITVWELTDGTMQQMMEGGMGAKPIHEAAGATVAIFTMPERMYYVMTYENFEDWGTFRDTPNPAFNAYMQGLMQENNGNLGAEVIERHTVIHQ